MHKKLKFSIKDFFSKCDQIRRKLWKLSYLPKKSFTENSLWRVSINAKMCFKPKMQIKLQHKDLVFFLFRNI